MCACVLVGVVFSNMKISVTLMLLVAVSYNIILTST